jgi:hypothetical protein
VGRATRLNDEVSDSICRLIRAGNTDRVSAVKSGVGFRTFCEWIEKGHKGKQPYRDFADAVELAKAEIEFFMVQRAFRPTDPDPETALTWLRTRRRNDWGTHTQVDATVEVTTRAVFRLPEAGDGDDPND